MREKMYWEMSAQQVQFYRQEKPSMSHMEVFLTPLRPCTGGYIGFVLVMNIRNVPFPFLVTVVNNI
jgi:hypothetical protein